MGGTSSKYKYLVGQSVTLNPKPPSKPTDIPISPLHGKLQSIKGDNLVLVESSECGGATLLLSSSVYVPVKDDAAAAPAPVAANQDDEEIKEAMDAIRSERADAPMAPAAADGGPARGGKRHGKTASKGVKLSSRRTTRRKH